MGIVALVMAGGKGARVRAREKPLLKIGGKSMIERVIDVLRNSRNVDEIIVAVSKYTPKTAEMLSEFSIKVVETPSSGYCDDMRAVIKKCGLTYPVLVISADLPLVTKELIDEVVKHYERCGKPALAVMVPFEVYERLGLSVGHVFKIKGRLLVSAGINVVHGGHIKEPRIKQEILILDRAELVVNVNTWSDLKIAEKLLAQAV